LPIIERGPNEAQASGEEKGERDKILEEEYKTLRKEIKHTKDRIFKLAGFGLIRML
jgi:hypothetical protein